MKTLVICLALGLVSAAAPAQTPGTVEPLPPGPLIQERAPKMARWLITLVVGKAKAPESPSAAGQKGAAPKLPWASKVAVTKTDEIIREETLDEKGQTWSAWCLPGLQITVWPDGKSWFVQQAQANRDPNVPVAMFTDYSKSDFPGFEWISEKNYTGIQKVGSKTCLVFRDVSALMSPEELKQMSPGDEGSNPTISVVASIDVETRLPVALTRGNEAHTYEFIAPPEQKLTFPPIVESLIENRDKNVQSVTRKSIRSF